MIEIIIDGHGLSVSNDLAFDIYDYNGIFDVDKNRGTFSYDIDIDLRCGDNAKIYKHFNRINGTSFFSGRKAEIYDSGRLLVEGREVILECNDKVVKIQIIGGSGNLNDDAGSVMLADLDLGTLPSYTAEQAMQTIYAEPLSVPAVCTPIFTESIQWPSVNQQSTRGKIINFADWNYGSMFGNTSWYNGTTFRGQPYLAIVVERVLQALGWTVEYNILRYMEYAKRLIIIHNYETNKICEMLPKWTASKFLEQIQLMFNVYIIVNKNKHTSSIFTRKAFYEHRSSPFIVPADNIIREDSTPGRKYGESEIYVHNYERVKYKLPSLTYGKRAEISDNINSHVTERKFNSFEEFNGPYSIYRNSAYYNTCFFYHTPTNTKWMLIKGPSTYYDKVKYVFTGVEQFAKCFKASDNEEKSDEIELEIVPAETIVLSVYFTNPNLFHCGVVLPVAHSSGNPNADWSSTSENGLNEWIEGNEPSASLKESDKLFVAHYMGRTNVLFDSSMGWDANEVRQAKYPQVFTHRYVDARISSDLNIDEWDSEWSDIIFDSLWNNQVPEENVTFDLRKRINTTYKNDIFANNKEVHTIYLKINEKFDVSAIFIISGRRFVCVSLQYLVRNCKLQNYAIGTFLPLE